MVCVIFKYYTNSIEILYQCYTETKRMTILDIPISLNEEDSIDEESDISSPFDFIEDKNQNENDSENDNWIVVVVVMC